MQQRGVEVVLRDNLFDRPVSPFIRRTVNVSRFETTTRHPDTEPFRIMITSRLASFPAILNHRESAHLTTPLNDG